MRSESGTATVEATFGIVVLMVLMLGVVEVSYVLYARNVVASSAHEGARAVLERGRDSGEAAAIARSTVESAAGGLVRGLKVTVETVDIGDRRAVVVRVGGIARPFGPVPFPVPLSSTATVYRDAVP